MATQVFSGRQQFGVILMVIVFLHNTKGILANCANRAIGLENKNIIPDSSFTASSHYDSRYVPSNARLNGYNGWGPRAKGSDEYLQIDLGYPYIICAVATRGGGASTEWVKHYKIMVSVDGTNWIYYKEYGQEKLFSGNTDHNSIVKHTVKKTLAKYIRFFPTDYEIWKTMRVGLYGYAENCDNLPLGMESGIIQSVTASSESNQAKNARLHNTSGPSWCASTSDSSPYLQIDLGSSHLICAVALQGNSMADKWVETYQMNTSINGTIWTTYQENNTDRIFSGNFDRSTVVRQVLYDGIVTRYIRILPKTSKTRPCLRTEIYGYQMNPACSAHSVGIPSSNLVPDHRFTATSYYNALHQPHMARLGLNSTWGPEFKFANDYLQIDLGGLFYLCSVATQGNGHVGLYEWVSQYKVMYSTNDKQWETYIENGTDKEFPGNTDTRTIARNSIKKSFKAKFIRVVPTKLNKWKSMRVDFSGFPAACASSLGIESSEIPNSQMTASSSLSNSNSASHGRLYGASSWCASNNEYIKVDLGQFKTVTGIATQGDKSLDEWVTSYKVSYSFDDKYWYDYKEGNVAKVFNGSSNKNDVIVNWLNGPIAARYLKISPQTSYGRNCLRFDLYGCSYYIPESRSLQATPEKRSVQLSWNDIQNNEGPASSFTVIVLNTRSGSRKNSYTKANSMTIRVLKPYTVYEASVMAIQAQGRPLWKSTSIFETKVAKPDGVPTVRLVAASSQTITIYIELTNIESVNGPMRGFTILYTADGGESQKIDVDKAKAANLTNLEKNTYYSISVSVKNTHFTGPASALIRIKTLEDVPEIGPQNTNVTKINDTAFLVTWKPLTTKQGNGDITKYEIIWHFFFNGPRPNTLCKEFFLATTKESQFLISNLKPYAKYTVYVRGYTSIGPGPNSTASFSTSYLNGIETSLCASEGDAVTLPCHTINDKGPIEYTWTKDGSKLPDGSVVEKKEYNDLIVKPVSDKDFGTYECTSTSNDKTMAFMKNRVKLKKCSKTGTDKPGENQSQVLLYVIPLVVVIVFLVIAIIFLGCRIRKGREINAGKLERAKNENTTDHGRGIENEAMTMSGHAPEAQEEQTTSKDDKKATYMELKPMQTFKPVYEHLNAEGRAPMEEPKPTTPQETENAQYMEIKPVVNTALYEELHPRAEEKASTGRYEDVGQFFKNEAMDTTEA